MKDYTEPLSTSQRIAGLQVSDGPSLQRARRLNRLLIAMTDPQQRAHFVRAPEELMERHGLSPVERQLLMHRDWQGMLEHGASIYALAKGSRVFGLSLLDIGAQMRGCSARELQQQLPIHTLRDEASHG